MAGFTFGRAHDYNDYVKQLRGFLQGHPQVLKSDDRDPLSGQRITGTGNGELFVSTESFTPAGSSGSPAGSPLPGTTYRLTCTVAGSDTTSPQAQFTVEQLGVSPSVLGTLTAGERWVPDVDYADFFPSPAGSPGNINSPEVSHGLELFLTTSTNWVVSDTIEFTLVDHNIGRDANDNFEEQLFTQTAPDANGDFVTRWHARIPTIANAAASPEFQNYVHMQTAFVNASSIFNLGLEAGNDFHSSNSVFGQVGSSSTRYMPLSNIPFPFWITADADGFYSVARIGSVYEHMTCQVMDVFATGNQHPLPIYVGAMSEISTIVATNTDNDQHAPFWDPGDESSAQFRWTDGTWYDIVNRNAGYVKTNARTRFITPWCSLDGQTNHTGGGFPNNYDWSMLSHQMIARYDGSYELLPATLILTDPQNAVVGDLKFVKYVSGNGLNSEDDTTDTAVSPNIDAVAFQAAQLSDNDNFCVMELVL